MALTNQETHQTLFRSLATIKTGPKLLPFFLGLDCEILPLDYFPLPHQIHIYAATYLNMPTTPRTPRKISATPYKRPTPQSGSSFMATRDLEVMLLVDAVNSSTSSDDDASAFAPDIPSPDVDEENGDIKPDLSDDEYEQKPVLGKGGKKGSRGKGIKVGSRKNGGTRAAGKVWTGQEDWALFQELHPKAKADWNVVAAATRRDSKVS